MNPNYPLFIDVQLTKPITSQSVWVRYVMRIPYVPREGDKIRLTNTDNEETLDLQLESVIYDSAEGNFMADLSDETMVENYGEDGTVREAEVVAKYTAFGFVRLNYPSGEGRP